MLYNKLQGRDLSSRPQVLDGLTQFVTTTFEGGGRMDLTLPEPRGKPAGNYLHVETRGRGPTPLLLISDLGVDGRNLYDSFTQRQQTHLYDAYRHSALCGQGASCHGRRNSTTPRVPG